MAFNIVGSDIYLPKNIWTAEQLDLHLGLKKGMSKKKYGVESRHVSTEHETAIYMASEAIKGALKQASLSINDIDLVIYASATQHQSLPYDASAVLAHLQAPTSITSLDINCSCLSFLSALDYAQSIFLAKRHQRIVIVSSERVTGFTLNKMTPATVEVATLFSDGAAAFVLERSDDAPGLSGVLFETHHQGYDLSRVRAGGSALNPHSTTHSEFLAASQFEMNGKLLFRLIIKVLPKFLDRGLKQAAITREQIDYFLPHQASHRALDKLPRLSGFPKHKTVNNFATLGNQIASSLPINLHLLRLEQAGSGKIVLLTGSAAGLSLGMGLLTL